MKDLRKVVKDIAREIIEQYGDEIEKLLKEADSEEDTLTPTEVIAGILTHELALRSYGLQGVSELVRTRVNEFPNSLDIDEMSRLGEMLNWLLSEEIEKRL